MRFNRVSLTGFKSFVEPTDLDIGPGMTGIVGPNGCGKSNVVEALRWVMGESAPSGVRATGMDDVIFDGTASRPARNIAEITLHIDNADRSAPASFNDSDEIEVCRRIQRESGSTYLVNGRETRARDVQMLFADAGGGAHSNAIVSQGQVGALVNAKPSERRRLLEEAAGVAGIHARRHEAELRLRAAEGNLQRLDDLLAEQQTQLAGLRRQARQAARYRTLSDRIRVAEARMALHRWREAEAAEKEALAELARAEAVVAERTAEAARASSVQAGAQAELSPLREAETEAAAALHRLTAERETLAREAEQLEAQRARLATDREQAAADLERERTNRSETAAEIARIENELAAAGVDESENADLVAARTALQAAEAAFREAEAAADAAGRAIGRHFPVALGGAPEAGAPGDAPERVQELEAARDAAEERRREAEARRREAEAECARLEAEATTLAGLLASEGDEETLASRVTITPGFERAVAAALGDDLDASPGEGPVRWRDLGEFDARPLPGGVDPLSSVVDGPPALRRRLRYTGLVDEGTGEALQKDLLPGQRLVDRSGALWRWDGYAHGSEESTPAARRFQQRNRLAAIPGLRDEAEAGLARAREHEGRATAALEEAMRELAAENDRLRVAANEVRATLDRARAEHDRLRHTGEARSAQAEAATAQLEVWRRRAGESERQEAELERRIREVDGEREALARRPAEIESALAGLADGVAAAEARQRETADARAAAETRIRDADRAATEANRLLGEAREVRVRHEGLRDQAVQRRRHEEERIAERIDARPDELEEIAALGDRPLPPAEDLERTLNRLERERETVGAVNLRAEQEAEELAARIDASGAEREELLAAIGKLRGAIDSLNREARQRLRDAFATIDQHFRNVFTRLFGGGEARLELVDSDDPLEAGLELVASPPGKRLQKLSLLSGGEKALAALSLLFAMFLTRPAPLCVLDEVDAPLDDSNVERFCSLLKEIVETSETRLVVVTHHRLTMARMDRLYGVTMREPGVSSLVSVNLAHAEGLREAG